MVVLIELSLERIIITLSYVDVIKYFVNEIRQELEVKLFFFIDFVT